MDTKETKEKIELLAQQKSKAIENQQYVFAADIRDEVSNFEIQLKNICKE